jgi:hypothetical protein
MSQLPKIIYKYVDQDGARKIIANRTLRFGRPSGMNDPFDVYIDDLFDVGINEIHQRWVPQLFEILEKDPVGFASQVDADPADVALISGLINSASQDKRAALLAGLTPMMLEEFDDSLGAMRDDLEKRRQDIIAQFQDSAIFCATLSCNNLLMWAHYAQQHRGVVLGFKPDIEQDSFLRLMKPVRYTDIRPAFYGHLEDTIRRGSTFTENDMTEFRDSFIYSKSTHWSYEEELRIDIPHGVPAGDSATFLNFYPSELCEMYLGVRADEAFKAEIITAARTLNPDIAIFDAHLEKGSYALVFKPVHA